MPTDRVAAAPAAPRKCRLRRPAATLSAPGRVLVTTQDLATRSLSAPHYRLEMGSDTLVPGQTIR
jgi:hypothetical protein